MVRSGVVMNQKETIRLTLEIMHHFKKISIYMYIYIESYYATGIHILLVWKVYTRSCKRCLSSTVVAIGIHPAFNMRLRESQTRAQAGEPGSRTTGDTLGSRRFRPKEGSRWDSTPLGTKAQVRATRHVLL